MRALPGGHTLFVGPDRNFWFTDTGGLEKMNVQGKIVSKLTLPYGCTQGAIVSGPGHSMWFAGGNSVGRITLSGSCTYVPTYTPYSGAQAVTVGPDRNLWFTETLSDGLGTVDPSTF